MFRKRLAKNFDNDAMEIYRFTHPKINQTLWPVARRQAAMAKLLQFMNFDIKRHKGPAAEVDKDSATAAVGDFLRRGDDCVKDYQTYWRCKVKSEPDLGNFLLALAWLCVTEQDCDFQL